MPYNFAGIEIFDLCCSCNSDLDAMTLYTNLTRIPLRYIQKVRIWTSYINAF